MEDNLNPNPERSDFSAADSNDVAADQISAGQTTKNGECVSADTTFDTSPKWTPGPWRMEIVDGKWRLLSGKKYHRITTFNCPVTRTEEEAATHKLIAAAPDLYEALEGLIEAILDTPLYFEQRQTAEAALAKARGEGVE